MTKINLNEARILITNDDGITADGIKILRRIANEFSNDVWVVAPEHEKSGASHALSFQNELILKKYEDKSFSVNGTPSDCVAIGISNVLKDKRPDIILSGINSGCNVGEDVTYSGTIAAAMEGLIRRIPSIAISQNYEAGKKNQISWDSSKFFLKNLLVDLTNQGWSNNVFMNINFPYCSAEKVKSIQVTTQGNRDTDDLIINEVEASKFRFGLRRRLEENAKLNLPPLNEGIEGYMTDVEAIANQHISVTPFHLDLTHHKSLEDLKKGLKTNLN
tara:strand:- start:989 stop:1813 length:825 start_codon:yes stop_codon:yes gene_type:complete